MKTVKFEFSSFISRALGFAVLFFVTIHPDLLELPPTTP